MEILRSCERGPFLIPIAERLRLVRSRSSALMRKAQRQIGEKEAQKTLTNFVSRIATPATSGRGAMRCGRP